MTETEMLNARIAELEAELTQTRKTLHICQLAAPMPEDAENLLDDALCRLHTPHEGGLEVIVGQAIVAARKCVAATLSQREQEWALRISAERKHSERVAELEAVIREALQPGVFGRWYTVEDPRLKHSGLLELCQSHGFGAVMHYAEYLWKTHTNYTGSEHTVAACASVRESWIADAERVLGITDESRETEDAA